MRKSNYNKLTEKYGSYINNWATPKLVKSINDGNCDVVFGWTNKEVDGKELVIAYPCITQKETIKALRRMQKDSHFYCVGHCKVLQFVRLRKLPKENCVCILNIDKQH